MVVPKKNNLSAIAFNSFTQMIINKLLIANRGEIAVRVIRTARKLGIHTVAIYSEVDADSLHVSLADEAYCIGHSELSDTYLNIEKILAVAVETQSDAIHPGYGFLSENARFVEACKLSGIRFIGPDVRAMQVMGNKIEARAFVGNTGVPVTRGLAGETSFIAGHIDEIGFPVLVKAAAGGGGKGMRIVQQPEELMEALESTSREAASYFADGTVYVEKYIENPRHIEFQILGDQHGNVVHLFERECSIQRRYQKIIEEAPSPTLNPDIREKMGQAAVAIGKAIGYSSAGTIEFLVDSNLDFYFLEMNTRIQVEHPVTELTTGIDIVEEQLHIACGESLRLKQEDIRQNGHAIECRIYAEDPENQFQPSPGKMNLYHEPSGKHIRVDSGIAGNPVIQSYFDPMISKLIVWGDTRESARIRMIEAIHSYVIHGIRNNLSYLLAILQHKQFIGNTISTKYCDEHAEELSGLIAKLKTSADPLITVLPCILGSIRSDQVQGETVWEHIGYWRNLMQVKVKSGEYIHEVQIEWYTDHEMLISHDGTPYTVGYHLFPGGKTEFSLNGSHYLTWISRPEPGKVLVNYKGMTYETLRIDMLSLPPEFQGSESISGSGSANIVSPMPGKVIKIAVEEGHQVNKGDLLLIVEAMKMENNILSPDQGIVKRIGVSVGDVVDGNTRLVELEEA